MSPRRSIASTPKNLSFGNDDVGGKLAVLLQAHGAVAGMASTKDALARRRAVHSSPCGMCFQLGNHRENFPAIEVRARGRQII